MGCGNLWSDFCTANTFSINPRTLLREGSGGDLIERGAYLRGGGGLIKFSKHDQFFAKGQNTDCGKP